MSMLTLRDFCGADAEQVDALGLAAFEQYRAAYADWPASSTEFTSDIDVVSRQRFPFRRTPFPT